MRCFSFSLLVLAVAVPTMSAAQTAAPNRTNPSERRVCRNNMDSTGSILGGRRICRTVAEWRQAEEQMRRELDRTRQGGGTGREAD